MPDQPAVRFFRTVQTGGAVFACSYGLSVWRVGAYQGAVAEASGMWPSEGIQLIEVTDDVAEWLRQRD